MNIALQRLAACTLAGLLLANGPAVAGTFAVNPTRASLSAKESAGVLTVRNDGDAPSVVQLEVHAWSQQNGEDILVPTKEILATPPIFTLPVGGTQIVRIGLRKAPDPRREITYRLILQEVPPPPRPDFSGLQVALRFSLPVFVLPAIKAAPVLKWQVRTAPGELRVALANTGNAHIQVASFRLSLPGRPAQPVAEQQPGGYVLAEQARSWTLKVIEPLPAGTSLHLVAQTDAGEMQADVVVAESE